MINLRLPDLQGKIALVTGGSRGIGREICLTLAEQGALIALNYLTSSKDAEEVKAEIEAKGASCLLLPGDVSVGPVVQEMVEKVVAWWGNIDILVNNAGITGPKFFTEIEEAEWDRMIAVHLKGTYNCCRYTVPLMLKKGKGKIINMSSVVGKSGGLGAGAHYCAAKAGIIGFTKALAYQLGPYNIQVNAVAPAMIDTQMIRWRSQELLEEHLKFIPLKRLGTCREVASAVAFLASEENDYINGATIDVNGGMYMD